MELLYRDEFGVHGRAGKGVRLSLEPIRASVRRAAHAAGALVRRVRQLSYERAFWAVIVALLVLFVIVLIAGETGVGRGGR